MPLTQQQLGQVTTDKTRTSGDQTLRHLISASHFKSVTTNQNLKVQPPGLFQ